MFEPSATSGSWDSISVARPWVVPLDDGSARLYYVGCAADGATSGLGMAVSDG